MSDTDQPVSLDEHRGITARKETEIRRRLAAVAADQLRLRLREAELERFILAAPSETWPDVAERARYLINLFAATPAARDPRRRKLIAAVLDDLKRLSAATETKE